MDPPVDLRRTDDPNWIPLQALVDMSSRNRLMKNWRTHGLNGKRSNLNPCGFSMWNPLFCQIGRKARLWPKIRTAKAGVSRGRCGYLMLHHDWGSLVHSGHSGQRFHSPLSCGILWDVWASKSNRTGLKIFIHSRFIFCRSHVVSDPQRQAWCVVRLPVVEPSCWLRWFFCGPSALTFPMLFL